MKWHKISEYAIRYGDAIPDGLSQRQLGAAIASCPTVCKVIVCGEEMFEAWADGNILYRGYSAAEAKRVIEGMSK